MSANITVQQAPSPTANDHDATTGTGTNTSANAAEDQFPKLPPSPKGRLLSLNFVHPNSLTLLKNHNGNTPPHRLNNTIPELMNLQPGNTSETRRALATLVLDLPRMLGSLERLGVR